jgi:hypothetical protein
MARKKRVTKIGRTSGQVAVGNYNRQTQIGVGEKQGDGSRWQRPWVVVAAVAGAVSAVAAVIALFLA